MADVQVIIADLKNTIGNLTVDNAILRAEIAERDELITDLRGNSVEPSEDKPATRPAD